MKDPGVLNLPNTWDLSDTLIFTNEWVKTVFFKLNFPPIVINDEHLFTKEEVTSK